MTSGERLSTKLVVESALEGEMDDRGYDSLDPEVPPDNAGPTAGSQRSEITFDGRLSAGRK
ncbi:hypothetical protein [Nocardia arizonensis]|uniref:hypothetical protein n=1 Tax=Nocardia arizonensis TaxID=1141647 RepID=UPI0006D158DD|nr:hypothetical protein [Nocardia arizonensis]